MHRLIRPKNMRTLLSFILAAAFVGATPGAHTRSAASQAGPAASEKSLVEGSREAIIKTGLTEAFFDRHFRVARVIDRPADRRVVWRLSVGGYEAFVNDSVGFYTEGGRRFDTHSVAATLISTSDITRTIPRPRAERIMRRCIGRFNGAQVEYRAHGPGGEAALLLTASAVVMPRGGTARGRSDREEREERERRERARQQTPGSVQRDEVGEEDEGGDGPVVLLGAVDLSNGKCTVGRGQAGPPVAPRPRARRGAR
jgi:hypothetical protein